MKQDVKKLWLAALRSGAYPQTKKRLHDDDGFCCLGVLCDVFLKETQTEDYAWKKLKARPNV